MEKFILKVALFLALQASIFALFWNPKMPRDGNYLAATIEKHQLLENTPPPRIIVVGGSSAALGINCQILEETLHRPVVNMSLVARLGIAFMLNEVEGAIRFGDVVVLSFEYDLLGGEGIELTFTQLLQSRPASARYIPVSRWKRILDQTGLEIIGGILRRSVLKSAAEADPVAGEYKRKFLDRCGCYIGHESQPTQNPPMTPINFYRLTEENRRRMVRFAEKCRNRGAFCVYTCPPHPLPLLTPVPNELRNNIAALAHIPGLTVLDQPLDHAYPTSDFFDSVHHLTTEAARVRTRKLAEELRKYVGTGR